MYPYNDNGRYNGPNGAPGWDDDSGTYHFSYVQPPAPAPEPPKKKKGGIAKVIALLLACALVGGGAGVGGAALYSALTTSAPAQQTGGGSTIYRNDTPANPVTVNRTEGLREMSLTEIYETYADSCVCVTVQVPVQSGYYYGQSRISTGSGSGFIVSEDGYIVTNYHVISGATAIKVLLNNGDSYDARLVGGEELNDVAVLKVDGVTGLRPVVLGDSDALRVGETVCTIGNALGSYSFSLTAGCVSGVGRTVTMSDGTVMNMIQTDCTINNGNSGGPLFDQYGRVVGITSAKLSNSGYSSSTATIEGMGFAIPLNDVIGIVTDFMQYGFVTGRPYMGITGFTIESTDQQRFGWPAGVYVNSVDAGSCAEKAGLRKGDIIVSMAGVKVASMNELASVKNRHRAGDTVSVTIQRDGRELELSITFDEQAADTGSAQPSQGQQNGGSSGNNGNSGSGSYDPWGGYFNPWSW